MHAKSLLKKVKQDYSSIAGEFDVTRKTPWPEFAVLLKYVKKAHAGAKKIKLLDVGCGNGRLAKFLNNESIEYVGIDNNREMLQMSKQNNPHAKFQYGDILKLPFPASCFDTIWTIALLHHLPNQTLRLKALKEIKRVLKKNGSFAITVWNLWQRKYKAYINKKTHIALIPWANKLKRYYYAFTAPELYNLLKKAGFTLIKNIYSKNNLAYICQKSIINQSRSKKIRRFRFAQPDEKN